MANMKDISSEEFEVSRPTFMFDESVSPNASDTDESDSVLKNSIKLDDESRLDSDVSIVASADPVDLSGMQKITPEVMENEKRIAAVKQNRAPYDEAASLMEAALESENERIASLDDEKSEVHQAIEEIAAEKKTEVKKVSVTRPTVTSQDTNPVFDSVDDYVDYSDMDDDMLYHTNGAMDEVVDTDLDDMEEESDADDTPTEADSIEQAMQMIRDLPETKFSENESDVIHVSGEVIKDIGVATIRKKSSKTSATGEQSFMNALANLKTSRYRRVNIPLVNTGVIATVIGTGAVDMQLLYSNVDNGTRAMDYEIERMKATLKGCIGTHPKMEGRLADNIHYADYQMMAYARLCATFTELKLMGTCPECQGEMRFTANPVDALLNGEKMEERIAQINAAESMEDVSYMTTEYEMHIDDLDMTIRIGHPSYQQMLRVYDAMKSIMANTDANTAFDRENFWRYSRILPFIRSLRLGSGQVSPSIWQTYQALKFLSVSDFKELTDTIKPMTEAIITPEFGFSGLVCPHCGKVVTIHYDTLDELIFYHIMVSQSQL